MNLFDQKPALDDLFFKYNKIQQLAKSDVHNLLNLLFYGPKGCGKTIQIYAFLASMLKSKGVYDLKNTTFEYDKKIMNYKSSIFHIEIDPLVLCSNEKYFIQYFLKQYIETINIGLNIPKIIVVKNADHLSYPSQLILRKMLESNTITSRFIFELVHLSKFCEPLKSRCLLVRINMPSDESILGCMTHFLTILHKNVNEDDVKDIFNRSGKIRNMKKIFGNLRY